MEFHKFTLSHTPSVALSKRSIRQTGLFYLVGYLFSAHLYKNFQLPRTIFRASKALQEAEGGVYSVGGCTKIETEGERGKEIEKVQIARIKLENTIRTVENDDCSDRLKGMTLVSSRSDKSRDSDREITNIAEIELDINAWREIEIARTELRKEIEEIETRDKDRLGLKIECLD